jgi:hypothetical protein
LVLKGTENTVRHERGFAARPGSSDIAAEAGPFVKQRLLDLADRYDGKRKTTITPWALPPRTRRARGHSRPDRILSATEQTENPLVSPASRSKRSKWKSIRIEAAMANTKYERAQARARLALIAPMVDEVTAAYFDTQVEKVLLEARQRDEKSDQELVSTLLDAVARKYFALGLREREHERTPDGDPARPKPTGS